LAEKHIENNIDEVFHQVTLEDNDFDPYRAYQVEAPSRTTASVALKNEKPPQEESEKSKTERLDD
jgi:hypothetical protein